MTRPSKDIFWARSEAESGRRVRPVGFAWWTLADFESGCSPEMEIVFGEWEVEVKPEVVEADFDCTRFSPTTVIGTTATISFEKYERLNGKRWRAVFTEITGE